MILHSITPVVAMQQMFADWKPDVLPRQTIQLSPTCTVEGTVQNGQLFVERIISTNPADFLGKELSPAKPVPYIPKTFSFP